jgi:hypothetical protein
MMKMRRLLGRVDRDLHVNWSMFLNVEEEQYPMADKLSVKMLMCHWSIMIKICLEKRGSGLM